MSLRVIIIHNNTIQVCVCFMPSPPAGNIMHQSFVTTGPGNSGDF